MTRALSLSLDLTFLTELWEIKCVLSSAVNTLGFMDCAEFEASFVSQEDSVFGAAFPPVQVRYCITVKFHDLD